MGYFKIEKTKSFHSIHILIWLTTGLIPHMYVGKWKYKSEIELKCHFVDGTQISWTYVHIYFSDFLKLVAYQDDGWQKDVEEEIAGELWKHFDFITETEITFLLQCLNRVCHPSCYFLLWKSTVDWLRHSLYVCSQTYQAGVFLGIIYVPGYELL
jgi:hypothetical protein